MTFSSRLAAAVVGTAISLVVGCTNETPAPSGTGGSSPTTGGSSTGGVVSQGGSIPNSGGTTPANSGGANSGGTNTGGNASGGTNTGGTNTGGKASGGTNTGGTNTGGKASGGTATGGGGTGGTGGTDDRSCSTGNVVVPSGYRLVWSDEFSVNGTPDSANWGYETGFVRNEEAQWYQSDNARVENGCLVIEARREQKANPNYVAGSSDWKTNRQYAQYTSSSLRTMGKRSWQFGRFEMRGRIKTQNGLWPAWWTLGVSGEWPSCGEIDIMEYYAGYVRANIACGTSTRWLAKWDPASWQVSTFQDKQWQEKFHIWRMDWNDQKIDLYLDDKLVNTANLADMLNADSTSPFRQAHYMILNLAVGGANGGDPSGTTFPTRFEVDYVRVFQQ
jgi:beta-glucanase (GH16 family)